MGRFDALLTWRLLSLTSLSSTAQTVTVSGESLAASLSVEGMKGVEVSPDVEAHIAKFRKLRTSDRERACNSFLSRISENPPTPKEGPPRSSEKTRTLTEKIQSLTERAEKAEKESQRLLQERNWARAEIDKAQQALQYGTDDSRWFPGETAVEALIRIAGERGKGNDSLRRVALTAIRTLGKRLTPQDRDLPETLEALSEARKRLLDLETRYEELRDASERFRAVMFHRIGPGEEALHSHLLGLLSEEG